MVHAYSYHRRCCHPYNYHHDHPPHRDILWQSNVDCYWDSDTSILGNRAVLGEEAASHVPSSQPLDPSFPFLPSLTFFCTGTALTRRQSLSETVTSPPQNGPQFHVPAGAMHHRITRFAPHTLQRETLSRAICFGRDIVQQVTLSLASFCGNQKLNFSGIWFRRIRNRFSTWSDQLNWRVVMPLWHGTPFTGVCGDSSVLPSCNTSAVC